MVFEIASYASHTSQITPILNLSDFDRFELTAKINSLLAYDTNRVKEATDDIKASLKCVKRIRKKMERKQRSTSWRSLKILFLSDRSCCRSVSFLFRPWNMAQSSRRFLSGTATNIIPTMPMMKKSIWRTLRQEKLTAC